MEKKAILRVLVRAYAGGGGARAEALLEAMTSDRPLREVASDRGISRQSLDALKKRCTATLAIAMKAEGLDRKTLLG